MFHLPAIVALKKNKYPSSFNLKYKLLFINFQNSPNELEAILPNVQKTALSFIYHDAFINFTTNESVARFPSFKQLYFDTTHVICFYAPDKQQLDAIQNTHDFYTLNITSDQEIQWIPHHFPFNPFETPLFNTKLCSDELFKSFMDSIKSICAPQPKTYQWFLFHREQIKIANQDNIQSAGSALLYSIRNPLDNNTPTKPLHEQDLFSDQISRDLNLREKFLLTEAQKFVYFNQLKELDPGSYVQGDLYGASDVCALGSIIQQQVQPSIQIEGRFAFLTQSEEMAGFCYVFDLVLKQLIMGAIVKYEPQATSFHKAIIGIFMPMTEDNPSAIELFRREWFNTPFNITELKHEVERFVDNPEAYQRIEACIDHPEIYTSTLMGDSFSIEEIERCIQTSRL